MAAKRLRINVVSLVKELEITLKMLINTKLSSKYRSVYKGKGLEFEDYRIYSPEDDATRIDWKASARSNETLIKLFREERNLSVHILLQSSASMIFGSTKKLKLEYAAEFVAAFSYFVLEANDKVGLLMFNDKIEKMIPPATGKRQFYVILNSLVNASHYGGGFNLEKAVDFTMKTSKERGLMIIVSDFIGMRGDWEKILKIASSKFDVIGVMVRDPRDEAMPEDYVGQVSVGNPYSGESVVISPDKIAEEYRKHVKAEEDRIDSAFLRSRLDLVKISTAEPFIKPLVEFFLMRRKRAWR
jgi:uncharacterized protein (DUF58 family)